MSLTRRKLLGNFALTNVALLTAGATGLGVKSAFAETMTIKVGALRTIPAIAQFLYDRFEPEGTKIEVIQFNSPTECKNAVVTGAVDFAGFGIAAAISGAAAGEPLNVIAGCCNGGMAVVAGKDSGIEKLADLKGKKVGIWPGSTQEIFTMERLKMEGMAYSDIKPVRVFFSEMHAALARGDIDAYVGAEPGPGISVATGVGKVVEYPYSTPMGSLNVILGTHPDTVAKKPEMVRAMMMAHRDASEYVTGDEQGAIKAAVEIFGMTPEAVKVSLPNVKLKWQLSDELVTNSKVYAEHMLALKQIRKIPDFNALMEPKFSNELV